ncbi:hypothetical protein [Frigidibacter sp. SD6-1]|uniref:hypothetical protein n=1 Tax=Frigidibacter sp. SD6-1 TaxID=3032581 RepID=UPI0024DFD477|nr:hypothetical protein [Frigidibacter sp. SD6-1]
MLIFWKERLVLLATPKTGSTSIETALEQMAHVAIRRPPELKHLSAPAYHDHMGPMLEHAAGERFTTVALMRDPIDWLGSWWRYRQRDDIRDMPRSTAGMSFEEAVLSHLDDRAGGPMNVGSQGQFLGLRGGHAPVDQVFRYEEIDRFVHFLEDRLGCELILPRLNVSPKGKMDLSDATVARLKAKLARDCDYYATLA